MFSCKYFRRDTRAKNFKKVSNLLGGDQYVTLPSLIVAFNLLIDKVESIAAALEVKSEKTDVDEILVTAFRTGRDKMLKHYHKTNWICCASLILDPRFKIETFSMTAWGRELKDEAIKIFEKVYKEEYANFQENHENKSTEDMETSKGLNSQCGSNEGEDIIDLDVLYEDTSEIKSWRDELDEYLSLARANRAQNILQWWQLRESSFPTLAKMARDLFSIQATSVPVERLFSLAGLIVTKLRNSLNDESIRALLCLKSWLSGSLKNRI